MMLRTVWLSSVCTVDTAASGDIALPPQVVTQAGVRAAVALLVGAALAVTARTPRRGGRAARTASLLTCPDRIWLNTTTTSFFLCLTVLAPGDDPPDPRLCWPRGTTPGTPEVGRGDGVAGGPLVAARCTATRGGLG